MKKYAVVGMAAMAVVASTASAALYTTSFDSPTYSAGILNGQDGWLAQTQWQADGAGNISNSNGGYVRGLNTGVLGSTAIGEKMTITSVITLGTYRTPSADISGAEEGIFQLCMTHQTAQSNFGVGLAAGLFYKVSTGDLELRANQGTETSGTSIASLGAASGLGGATYTLTTAYTKTASDTWSVLVSLSDGINPATTLSYVTTGAADLNTDSDGGGTAGGFQALPSGGGNAGVATSPFANVTLASYSIEVIPEPATLGMVAAMGGLALFIRRRFML